jgi:uncharacterized membrane protein
MDNLTEVLKIFLTALTPIGELRASIPLGLTVFHQPIWIVFVISVIGNMIPPMLILWLFPKISEWLMAKSRLMNRFLTWLFERTRKKTKDKIERYGDLALIIFVAIPLPNTGAWTGALAAWLFGIPFKKAVPNIFYGVLIAGVVVTLITTGLKNLFP